MWLRWHCTAALTLGGQACSVRALAAALVLVRFWRFAQQNSCAEMHRVADLVLTSRRCAAVLFHAPHALQVRSGSFLLCIHVKCCLHRLGSLQHTEFCAGACSAETLAAAHGRFSVGDCCARVFCDVPHARCCAIRFARRATAAKPLQTPEVDALRRMQ